MTELTISEASELLRQKQISPVDLTTTCLERIEQLNPLLNAFITVTPELALAQAREAEHEIQHDRWLGPLHGIPIGLKDLIDTAGVKTTCASALFAERVPRDDAAVVQRLKRAGAVLLGKQNMQEFAYGGTSVPSHYGPVHNPWDLTRIAGGSSGGSAAAVAAGMCFGALGSDTGGSIRQPAAFCGIVGLKPTYGRVSTCGVMPLSWSLDHIGPFARTVTDVALLLESIAGYDELDPTSVDWPTEDYAHSLPSDVSELRLGVVRRLFFADLDPEIEKAVNAALALIGKMTKEICDVDLPDAPTTVIAPEAFAVHRQYLSETPELYETWTRERLTVAGKIGTVDYVEGRRELERVRRVVNNVFSAVDLLVTPTTPVPPITIEEATRLSQPPSPGEVWLRNTRPFNAYGLPTISIPCGFTSGGLPIGLQIAGPCFSESKVLALAHAFEQATAWHKASLVIENPKR